jgi:hypothetical protein
LQFVPCQFRMPACLDEILLPDLPPGGEGGVTARAGPMGRLERS